LYSIPKRGNTLLSVRDRVSKIKEVLSTHFYEKEIKQIYEIADLYPTCYQSPTPRPILYLFNNNDLSLLSCDNDIVL